MTAQPIISVRNLSFEYNGKKALENVSFDIPEGSVTALVGPNGAGKTTLLRCLVGLEKPVAGAITVAGTDVIDDPRGAHRSIGYLSDFFGLYDTLTVRQCLTYMAWCQKIAPSDINPRISALAAKLKLTEKLDELAGTLSRGNRQRLGIALALVHNPKILILDEPASGMDPEARARLSHMMLDLKAQGKTLIVSSHILNELEDYCTDMLVIRDGKVGDHVILKEYRSYSAIRVRIAVAGGAGVHLEALKKISGVRDAAVECEHLTCNFASDAQALAQLLKDSVAAGIPVCGFTPAERKLQDAYMDLAHEEK